MAHFFISYASPDAEKAREICALLVSGGATYWIAPDSIEPWGGLHASDSASDQGLRPANWAAEIALQRIRLAENNKSGM